LGILLSILNFARIAWLESEGILVALTVCAAMIVIVMSAKIIGSMLPILAKKVKIDPALMANPMIASLTDLVSVVVYFMLARLLLGI
jgi:magnesium transporter